MKTTVVLADDHKMVAEAIARVLEQEFELAGVAENGQELIDLVARTKPNVAVVDITMPILNGIEACKRIRKEEPDTRVLFLSMHSDLSYIGEAIRAGASGYVLKRCAVTELPQAIRTVSRGEVYVTPLVSADKVAEMTGRTEPLTARQREVLQLVADGKSAKEIAAALNISVKTAEFHKAGIMQKLGLRTTAQLTKYAISHGLTPV